jgi:acetylornithine deacetylase/succinyl-diaminopimelate desuccinylase-like protein
MWRVCALVIVAATIGGAADDNRPLGDRTRQYLTDLVRLDTSNPPGNETRVAQYLKQVADSHGIYCELQGSDPTRLNFIARLKGSGKGRPLLMMAHTDVVPAERSQWSVDPFSAENRGGFLYGRGTQDDKSLLAAELAVMVELKRRNIKLGRDLILLAESDEEAGSTGIEWMIKNKFSLIDSEFALNEGGFIQETKDGPRVFHIQTTEKIPTRIILTAKGVAADGSAPRADDPVTRVAIAVAKLAQAEQPVRINQTTRRYLRELSRLPEYSWLDTVTRRKLDDSATAQPAASQIRAHDPELDDLLHTTVAPTMFRAGSQINVIPNSAEARLDVRRLPSESREEVLARFKAIINDPAVEITFAPGQQMPAAEPSAVTTVLYHSMERAIGRLYPRDVIVPYMSRGATDSSFLRARGTAVYGVPVFLREPGEGRSHGNDERILPKVIEDGVELLWQMVTEAAGDR